MSAWFVYGPPAKLQAGLFRDRDSRVIDAATAGLEGRVTVLDVGAGWGFLSFTIAERLRDARIICLDSEFMLRRLCQEAEKRGLSDRLQPLEASAYQIKLDEDSVDVAVCQDVFHELKRPAEALNEMVRVLRPGGRAVVADMRGDTLFGRLNGAHHGRGSHGSWRPQELEDLFRSAGLQDVRVTTAGLGIIGVGVKEAPA